MALRKEEERKQLQARTGGGVFSLIFKRGKPSVGTGSLSSENRSISPSHSDDSRSITPPALQQQILPSIPQEPVEKPKPPQRKRRVAPKPPQQVDEQRKNSVEKPASHISTTSDGSEIDSSQRKSDGGLTICHSRNSSDSSGYHEPSVLSDHCNNTSLPRRSKRIISEVVSEEIVCEKRKVDENLLNMATFSKSTASIAGRKKKAAPLPPPVVLIKTENVVPVLEKASPAVDASITPPAEKQDLPRLQPRTRKSQEPPKPAPRQKSRQSCDGSIVIVEKSDSNFNEDVAPSRTSCSVVASDEPETKIIVDLTCDSPDFLSNHRYSLPCFASEDNDCFGSVTQRPEDDRAKDMTSSTESIISISKSDIIEKPNIGMNFKKWSSLDALDQIPGNCSFMGVDCSLVVGANNYAEVKSKPSRGSLSLPKEQHAPVEDEQIKSQTITLPNKLVEDCLKDSRSSTVNAESHCTSGYSSLQSVSPTYKLDSNVDTLVNDTLSFNSESAVSYKDNQPVKQLFSSIPNIPVEQIETDLERHQNIDRIIEDINDIDWEFQIPPPPTEFRDTSPINKHKGVKNKNPAHLDNSTKTETDECDNTVGDDTKPMLNTLTLENLEKRKSLVYNREISTSLKIAQESNDNSNVDANDIVNKRSSMLNELEGVIQNGGSRSLVRHVEQPIIDNSLPNFKISTYAEPKTKIHIFEDDSVTTKSEEILSTNDDRVFKKPYEFNKYKTTSRNNFYVKHQNHNNIMRSESFSSNILSWKPNNPVQRSKSQVALNKLVDGQENKTEDSSLTKSNSLFDVSGLQSLEVMRVIQNKLNTPSSSTEQLLNGDIKTTSTSINGSTTLKEDISINLPPTECENTTNTKTYHYQGPPAINLSTWSERPKSKVSLKEDTDYRISVKTNGTTSVQINETQVTHESGNTVKVRETKSNIDARSRFVHNTPNVGYRKPLANITKIENTTRPHSIAFERDFDISRVPIVRAVELKKSVTQITNDNNRYSDMCRSSEAVNTIINKNTDIKPVQRVNSFAQNRPNVGGFRGIEIGNDNTARSRKSWNVPNSYSTLPTKINLIEPPVKSCNYTANSNVPFSQLSLKRVESSKTSNDPSSIILRNTVPHPNSNRFSTGSQFVLKETQPPPPPMPQITRTARKPISCNGNSGNSRDDLLNSIRNFGGAKGLRHVKV